jgi:hypothetical protein
MDAGRWAFTLEHLAAAYEMAALPPEAVYREEFLWSAMTDVTA